MTALIRYLKFSLINTVIFYFISSQKYSGRYAVAPEPDGTYAYFFIMNPFISKGNYDIESLLTKMYGATTGKEHFKLYNEALGNEGRLYKEVQSRN
ncbi:hypothetical protein [Adhaeribacter radiodurans]|uniref:Uncharacterized protein n=1 Tax=Adhaeribacter radiodurans TaxID=2745197 RepID=A0A7L7LC30_9BACT|nr:hypothetical protein [Adhaeribacter radiodurans]QMU30402.1 hypothetical protein HUW48_21305 [Adhaeribacter radiodurans]